MGSCRPRRSSSSCGSRLLLFFFICYLAVVVAPLGYCAAAATVATAAERRDSQHLESRAEGWQNGRGRSSHMFDVSKRRVPNGADPIHNRRAGKAGRPPGRA